MSTWPVHPLLTVPPDQLGLVDRNNVQLPEPVSSLHVPWLDQAAAVRGDRPVPVPLRDPAGLERDLRALAATPANMSFCGVYGPSGSGRTSVLLAMAGALLRQGRTVALLDADVSAPSLRRRLRCLVPPIVVGGLVLPYVAQGMRVQGLDAFWPAPGPLPWQGKDLQRVLERYREDVFWANPDVLLIDLPPIGDARLVEIAAFFGGQFVRVQGPTRGALEGPAAFATVANAAQAGGDVTIPYVLEGDLSETLCTLLSPLAARLAANGSSSVS